jgi:hypothetical protein
MDFTHCSSSKLCKLVPLMKCEKEELIRFLQKRLEIIYFQEQDQKLFETIRLHVPPYSLPNNHQNHNRQRTIKTKLDCYFPILDTKTRKIIPDDIFRFILQYSTKDEINCVRPLCKRWRLGITNKVFSLHHQNGTRLRFNRNHQFGNNEKNLLKRNQMMLFSNILYQHRCQ